MKKILSLFIFFVLFVFTPSAIFGQCDMVKINQMLEQIKTLEVTNVNRVGTCYSSWTETLDSKTVNFNQVTGCEGKLKVTIEGNGAAYGWNCPSCIWSSVSAPYFGFGQPLNCSWYYWASPQGCHIGINPNFYNYPYPDECDWSMCFGEFEGECNVPAYCWDMNWCYLREYKDPNTGESPPYTIEIDISPFSTFSSAFLVYTSSAGVVEGGYGKVIDAEFIPSGTVECTTDDDCPPNTSFCDGNYKKETEYYCNNAGVCVENQKLPVYCGDDEETDNYFCECSGKNCEIKQRVIYRGCETELVEVSSGTMADVGVCYERSGSKLYEKCPVSPDPAQQSCKNDRECGLRITDNGISCVDIGSKQIIKVKEEVKQPDGTIKEVIVDKEVYSSMGCTTSIDGQCIARGGAIWQTTSWYNCVSNDPPPYKIDDLSCTEVSDRKKIQECGACMFATDAPNNQKCGTVKAGADGQKAAGILQKYICTSCVENGGDASCEPTNEEWRDAMSCGTPQTVTKKYCSGKTMCTLTANYPGECFYNDLGVVGGCKVPTIDIVCNGPCENNGGGDGGGNDGDRNPGPNPNPGPGPNPPDNDGDDDDGNDPDDPDDPDDDYGCNSYNQCAKDGSGASCSSSEDCQNSETQCNDKGQCVEDGGGIACDENTICPELSCSADNKCVSGGGGKGDCATDADCEDSVTKCSVDGMQCSIEGDQMACDNVTQCKMGKRGCIIDNNGNGKCVVGGTGGDCSTDADCPNDENSLFCNDYLQCVPNGSTGTSCSVMTALQDCGSPTNTPRCMGYQQCKTGSNCGSTCISGFDCQGEPTCNKDRQCEVDGGGIACRTDNDCVECEVRCKSDKCVVGGPGKLCDTDEDCQEGPKCTSYGQCVNPGHPYYSPYAIGCSTPGFYIEECQYPTSCDFDRKCVPGGGGWLCTREEDCEDLLFGCTIDGKCRPGGGLKECSADSDCSATAVNLKVYPGPYCLGIPNAGVAYFEWNYSSGGQGTQKMAEIQISKDKNFDIGDTESLVFKKTIQGSGKRIYVYVTGVKQIANTEGVFTSYTLSYKTPYYWRVRVQGDSQSSPWIYYDGGSGTENPDQAKTYTYKYPHASPIPVYYTEPASAAPGERINFIESSMCFETDGTVYACKTLTTDQCKDNKCYTWNFGDGSGESNVMDNVSHFYRVKGKYTTELQVCDDYACCTATKIINISTSKAGEIPFWKEISPF